jgi:hypothetical protein
MNWRTTAASRSPVILSAAGNAHAPPPRPISIMLQFSTPNAWSTSDDGRNVDEVSEIDLGRLVGHKKYLAMKQCFSGLLVEDQSAAPSLQLKQVISSHDQGH